ncbi:hypothetical protein BH24DEI1_BH24DEI1_01750 [soil metagenome]|jgi:hypothetical protein|nr:DUF3147 family protein [Deinococcota bacterium]
MPVWLKYLISAGLVVAISEVAKRSDRAGAVLGALPWVTTLAMIWLFVERQGDDKIANHAYYTFWYVLPTLPMFLLIPYLLKRGLGFPVVLVSALVSTGVLFVVYVWALKRFGIDLV